MSNPYKQAIGVERNGLHLTTTNYQDLANAIVLKAAQDYMMLYRQFVFQTNGTGVRKELRKLERFFHSGWYRILTSVDGDYLLKKLREHVLEEGYDD